MKKLGMVGWRGMVGSVLMDRMREENDFALVEPTFFTTSNAGGAGPDVGQGSAPLQSATDIAALAEMDVIVTCQGGDYTNDIFPKLRAAGWSGYWIDAASALRTPAFHARDARELFAAAAVSLVGLAPGDVFRAALDLGQALRQRLDLAHQRRVLLHSRPPVVHLILPRRMGLQRLANRRVGRGIDRD
jgi:hypothetical protein